jgi:hypothetical protein
MIALGVDASLAAWLARMDGIVRELEADAYERGARHTRMIREAAAERQAETVRPRA